MLYPFLVLLAEMEKIKRDMDIYFFIYRDVFKEKWFFFSRNDLNLRRNTLSISRLTSRNGKDKERYGY